MKTLISGWRHGYATAVLAVVAAGLLSLCCGGRRRDTIDLSLYERPLEARLSGDFRYRSCADTVSAEAHEPWLACSASPPPVIEPTDDARTERGRSSDGLVDLSHHAILLRLKRGGGTSELDQALSRLHSIELRTDDPRQRARIRSDMAAIYYSQAKLNDDPSLLVDALEASSSALRLVPDLEEALFDQALTLTELSLGLQARRAWQHYLEVDATSPWGLEAGKRLAALSARQEQGDAGDALTVLLDSELERWGAAKTAADGSRAKRIEGEVSRMAAELFENGRDRFLLDLADELSRLDPERLAQGFSAYARGRRAFENECYEEAETALGEARRQLYGAGSVLGYWTDIWLAGADLHTCCLDEALDRLTSLEAVLPREGFPSLAGRLHWARGLALSRLGRHGSAYAEYTAAEEALAPTPYRNHLAVTRGLKAEALTYMGLLRESWHDRAAALRQLGWGESWASHNVLIAAADTARDLGRELAFRIFSEEAVEHASRHGSAADRLEARLWRADGLRFFGDEDAARDDLIAAARELGGLPANDVRERLAADVELAAYPLAANAEIVDGLSILDAIDLYRQRGPKTRLVDALVAQARTLRHDDDFDAAAASLNRVAELLAEMNADLETRRSVLAHWERSQQVLDEWFELRLERGEPLEQLLGLAELARTLPGKQGLLGREAFARSDGVPGLVLDRRVVFVYLVTPSRVVAWSLGARGIESRVLDVSTRELERQTEAFVANLRQGVIDVTAAQSLYEVLLGWSSPAGAVDEIVVVPDRFLHQLPFAALIDGATGRHLVEEVSLRTVLSLRALAGESATVAAARYRGPALVVGNPEFDARLFPWLKPLAGAEDEARGIAPLFAESRVLEGAEATKEAVLAALPGASIVHLAAHTVPSREAGDDSPLLVLADDGSGRWQSSVLTASDIAPLDLGHTDLVFLSGCRTSPGSRARMQGLYGLAAPFLERGAGAVVATFWDIDDRASVPLVQRFYAALLASGDAAAALREAQLSMLQSSDPELRSPRTWAAFQLFTHDLDTSSFKGKENS